MRALWDFPPSLQARYVSSSSLSTEVRSTQSSRSWRGSLPPIWLTPDLTKEEGSITLDNTWTLALKLDPAKLKGELNQHNIRNKSQRNFIYPPCFRHPNLLFGMWEYRYITWYPRIPKAWSLDTVRSFPTGDAITPEITAANFCKRKELTFCRLRIPGFALPDILIWNNLRW